MLPRWCAGLVRTSPRVEVTSSSRGVSLSTQTWPQRSWSLSGSPAARNQTRRHNRLTSKTSNSALSSNGPSHGCWPRFGHWNLISFCLLFEKKSLICLESIPMTPYLGGFFILLDLSATPASRSWTLEGVIDLTRRLSRHPQRCIVRCFRIFRGQTTNTNLYCVFVESLFFH